MRGKAKGFNPAPRRIDDINQSGLRKMLLKPDKTSWNQSFRIDRPGLLGVQHFL